MSDVNSQSEIGYLLRLHVASSGISRAVVRSASREELLREVVRILVDAGKFAMAVIAWPDPATHELVAVARAGDTKGYVDHIRVFADDSPEGQGPSGTAFRNGTPYICNDFLNDPRTLPWREAAHASDWRASAAVPILRDGLPVGLLSVYARELGFFGPDQVELLQQVAIDVAYGLERLAHEEQRRQAEESLSASEQRLKLAMDAARLGVFDRDLVTRKIVWTGHTERIFGFAPGSFDGNYASFEGRVHPDDLPKLKIAIDAARESHSSFSHEYRIVWPDGSEHWLLSQGEFCYGDSGQPYGMYGTVMDITDRKRTEAALRTSEDRLRQAVRTAQFGIFDHDHITGTIYWSPEQRAIHGWSQDERVTLQVYFERVHPDDREKIAAAVKRAHDPAGNGLFDVEHRLLFPDGSIRWTATRSQTFFQGSGAARRAVRTVGAVRDITEQKRAEEEQQKLATLVAMSREFIGIATPEGRVVYLNHAAMTMVGLESLEEACQKTVFDFFAESDRAGMRDGIHAAVRSLGYWSGETRLQHFTTGKLIDVDMIAFQIYDDHGAPLYVATEIRDITEKKRAAAEKARLQEQLVQAQKMESIGRLAGGVAHDFNNLLTVINGYSQLALDKLHTADPLRATLAKILQAGGSAAGLTRQLLAFSRKQVMKPCVLDLNRVVQEVRPMLERLVGEDVEVRVALSAESGTVYADPHQMEQVIMNLAVNARDAMPGGGRLLIETAGVELDRNYAHLHPAVNPGRYVMLAVSDSGTGMDEATQQWIFEPFFSTKPTGQGTGLGLSMVQGIVEQSGGHINVDSEPGQGTVFKIYLPARIAAATEVEKPSTVPVPGGKETVLVVEDLTEVRDYAVAALKNYGYHVIPAESAAEALLICEREHEHIHLVLTDVVMPNLSGRELSIRLEKLRPGTKVLFMSGYTDNTITPNGTVDGSIPFIEKPFTPEELARKVRTVMGPPASAARILVADDEADVRSFLRTILENGGYQVIEAADGKQLLQQTRAGQVDLVITDLVMPEQEGLTTIQTLRREDPGVGVIAISGAFGGRFLKTSQLLGSDAVLKKPVSAELLLAKVAELLKPRQ